jgi:hypothetical protein
VKSIRETVSAGLGLFAVSALVFFGHCSTGCALFTPKNAHSVLDAVQIACVFGTELVDEQKVADVCGVARDLLPIIRNLIGQREGAKRSGVRWPDAADGGAP